MQLIFSKPELIRHLWQLKTVGFPALVSIMCSSIVAMLNVVMLSVVMLSVVMLSVVAPFPDGAFTINLKSKKIHLCLG